MAPEDSGDSSNPQTLRGLATCPRALCSLSQMSQKQKKTIRDDDNQGESAAIRSLKITLINIEIHQIRYLPSQVQHF